MSIIDEYRKKLDVEIQALSSKIEALEAQLNKIKNVNSYSRTVDSSKGVFYSSNSFTLKDSLCTNETLTPSLTEATDLVIQDFKKHPPKKKC